MPNYALIDLGSNTVRLCIYQVNDTSNLSYTHEDFKTLLNSKKIAGLANFVEAGEFSQSGITKAIRVLKDHKKSSEYFNCKKVEVFATAVLRNCTNSSAAIKKIESATGLKITLLSETQEAKLGFTGANCTGVLDDGVLIDVGGGSTEFSRIKNKKCESAHSIPIGTVSSYARNISKVLPLPDEAGMIKEKFITLFNNSTGSNNAPAGKLYGIGGGVRSIFKFYSDAFLNGEAITTLTQSQIEQIFIFYQGDSRKFAHQLAKTLPERMHTFLPGCIIVSSLFDRFDAKSITVCKKGVREGYLIDNILRQNQLQT